jgi:crotonobetainyl-CoA:carnitine CoA-transferase CaiB-like acyl-CoA transferase
VLLIRTAITVRRFGLKKSTDEVVKLFLDQGFPIAPVMNIKEIFVGEHMNLRKMLIEVDHPEIGKMKLINTPVKLLSVPIEEYIKATAPPLLGEHTDEVLSKVLGYTKEQLDQLHLENVIK